ncbi:MULTISPECIES: hypothetical protein [Sorangium]|uniref:3-oxoacyl-ACP synthase n=1 Tax=Sorangium cellulosum (strain So ce56) TaxID=448385 RepID=A9EW13_SORC5|nr:hypothetical protein [Sorangium cellulosum]CAN94277.1 hypothetical protein predicted by Glimmer/Critica [Sorangium cellulosum So ce56]
MSLSIVGTGLVSPFGFTPREHVVFRHAGVPAPSASPFLLADDKRLRVYSCAFLDPALPVEQRIAWLASASLQRAIAPLLPEGVRWALHLVLPAPRPGVDRAALQRVERALDEEHRPTDIRTYSGEAGTFAALGALLSGGRGPDAPAAVVAADSFVSLRCLTHLVEHPRTRWEPAPPIPSEAGAALLVVPPQLARTLRLRALGAVLSSATIVGAATDGNDEPVDATEMTALLRQVAPPRLFYAAGQDGHGGLRMEDFHAAAARLADRFWDCQHDCLEGWIGAVGACSGAASLVYALERLRIAGAPSIEPTYTAGGHAPPPRPPCPAPAREPFLAWAISADGTRGAASAALGDA